MNGSCHVYVMSSLDDAKRALLPDLLKQQVLIGSIVSMHRWTRVGLMLP